MTYNNIQTEPAFITNEKSLRTRPIGVHKSLTDCCYSVSNLALIIACIVALVISTKFLHDDPLYEYGDHLLTLRFYRQLVYIIVILPLTLLVPLFNAASAIFLSGRQKFDLGTSLLTVVLVAVLVFIGLVFIAPSIKFSSVANQLSYEIRGHMKHRYDNDFSFIFLDRIQEEYKCCDELWYRANYLDNLPLTCFRPDGTYSTIYEKTCDDVIGSLVSNRCIVMAISFVVILVALSSLVGIDIIELTTFSSRQYDIGSREANLAGVTSLSSRDNNETNNGTGGDNNNNNDDDDDYDHVLGNRLKLSERERETPLLPTKTRSQQPFTKVNGELSQDLLQQPMDSYNSNRTSPILTHANYISSNHRPQSPVFVSPVSKEKQVDGTSSSLAQSGQQSATITTKSVLKKSTSIQRIDSDDDEEIDVIDYQRQIQRDLQTRRSLLSVRFAE